jgi:hypothetical protein
LVSHKAKLEYYNKTLEFEDEEGRKITLQGIQNFVPMRQISALQVKK